MFFDYQKWRLAKYGTVIRYVLIFHNGPSSNVYVLSYVALSQNAGIGIHVAVFFDFRVMDVSCLIFRTTNSATLIKEEAV